MPDKNSQRGNLSCMLSSGFGRFIVVIISFLVLPVLSQGQSEDTIRSVTMDDAVLIALDNHPEIHNARLRVSRLETMKGTHLDLKPTRLNYFRGEIHSPLTQDLFTLSQTLGSPLESYYKGQQLRHEIRLEENATAITEKRIALKTKLAFNEWIYLHHKKKIRRKEMNLYADFQRIASLRHQQGVSTILEKTTADTKLYRAQNNLNHLYKEIARAENRLRNLMFTDHKLLPATDSLHLYRIQYSGDDPSEMISNMLRDYHQEKVTIEALKVKAQKADLLPDIRAGYFSQNLEGQNSLNGWSIGISVPLWFRPKQAEIKKARIDQAIAENNRQQQLKEQQTRIQDLLRELNALREQLDYYHNQALKQAELLVNTSRKKYAGEDISYTEYIQGIQSAWDIRSDYLKALKSYNEIAIELEFYIK